MLSLWHCPVFYRSNFETELFPCICIKNDKLVVYYTGIPLEKVIDKFNDAKVVIRSCNWRTDNAMAKRIFL